jgi:hypothetical protein
MAQTTTGMELRAKVFPLAFILYLFKPTIVVDGQPMPGRWGVQFVPLAAGNHRVTVFFKYLFIAKCNEATIDVTVSEGQVVPVTYKSRWLIFLKGLIAITPAA